MSDNEYVYEIIKDEKEALLCAELVAEEFCMYNPITIFDRLTSKIFYEECAWPLIKDVLDEGLSFLVRHRLSGEIVGASFAGDLNTHHHKNPYDPCSPPSAIAVNDLLEEMDNRFILHDFGQELKSNLVLHITLTAVRAQHSGKGLASQLMMAMCNYAYHERGFQYVLVQVTNPATRHIYVDKMHGKEVTMIDPTQWAWKKKSDQLLYPYKDYKHGSIPNILIELKSNKNLSSSSS